MTAPDENLEGENLLDNDRRKFLAACGRFAVITPPALTLLLSTSLNSDAIARSGASGDRDPHRGRDRDGDRLGWLERLLAKLF